MYPSRKVLSPENWSIQEEIRRYFKLLYSLIELSTGFALKRVTSCFVNIIQMLSSNTTSDRHLETTELILLVESLK